MTRTPSNSTHRIEALFVAERDRMMDVLKSFEAAIELGQPSGIALVVDGHNRLIGTVTDGDVRRAMMRSPALEMPVSEVMRRNPIVFREGMSYQTIIKQLPKELEKRGRRGRRFLGKIILVDAEERPTRVLEYHQLWEQRVATHRHVIVSGLGYVGLTLGLRLAESGFRVTGVDVDADKVATLSRGESYVHEIGLPELLREQIGERFNPQTTVPDDGDVFVIAVGTPVTSVGGKMPAPQLEMLRDAVSKVAAKMTPGALVVLRSTVPIGCTREVVAPILEEISGLRCGSDFHLAFAPERTIEGRALQELRELPQIIGGINEDSVEATSALFRELTSTIVRVESLEAAEMAKLINNSYRDVIFGFANEMSQIASAFNLDVGSVINAANKGYPRDPVPLPSPGVGGPCLTKDPYILAAAAKRSGLETTLSQRGRAVNESMTSFVVDSLLGELEKAGKKPKESKVLLCGLAFKGHPETTDVRNSTSLDIALAIKGRVGTLLIHDPVVPAEDIRALGLTPAEIPAAFSGADAAMFLNNHPSYRKLDVFEMVRSLRGPGIVYDAWRLFQADELLRTAPSVYMGLGFVRRS